MNLIYGIHDRPRFGQVLLFALQQLLAILAATIAVSSSFRSWCRYDHLLIIHKIQKPGFPWIFFCFPWIHVCCICRCGFC